MAKKYLLIIENKNNDLIQINATKDKLFSIIAHDLRSPFNTILGYIDLLKSDYEILNENERRKYINIIDKSADASFQLLENLLLWSSSQSNKIEIVKEELNLRNMLTEAIAAYLPGATMKNINVTIRIPDDLIIYADNFTIKSVMANLFNNAVKFTSSGGDIKIDGIRSTNFIQITIYDNGIGIPEEVIPKLFQIETNISTLGTNKEKGSGLGLLLCKEFIEKNGGRIWIESEFGKGTKAIITIPEQMNKYGAQ
ncbi:MAG: HAMP domain-containing histidine kinase [Bacteroidetes bacterium]|nr:HAMP domain-containing histidine kinase [Bacteroidota bacterium]